MWWQLSQQDEIEIPRGGVYSVRDSLSLGITTKTMVAQDILRGQQGNTEKPGEGHLCPPDSTGSHPSGKMVGPEKASFPLTTAAGQRIQVFISHCHRQMFSCLSPRGSLICLYLEPQGKASREASSTVGTSQLGGFMVSDPSIMQRSRMCWVV